MNPGPFRLRAQAVVLIAAASLCPPELLLGQTSGSGQLPRSKQIVHTIVERAYDTNWPITLETRRIDANSDVIVSFEVRTNLPPAPPSPEWIALTNVLDHVQRAFARRADLQASMQALDLSDTNAIARIKAANDAFSRELIQQRRAWKEALGFGNDNEGFARIETGEFDGLGNPLQPYFNLSRYLTNRLHALNQQAAALAEQSAALVTVQAFHSPVGKSRTAVHVENYDNIPAGELQPIDRTGLRLTPAEQARLQMELDMSEHAANCIREIQKSRGQVLLLASNLVVQLEAQVRGLQNVLQQGPSAWNNLVLSATNTLSSLAQHASDPAARQAAAVALTNLLNVQQDLDAIAAAAARAASLKATLTSAAGQGPAVGLSGQSGVVQQLLSFARTVEDILQRVRKWPVRLEALQTNLPVLAAHLSGQEQLQALPADLQQFASRVQSTFPETIKVIQAVREFLTDQGFAEAADTLAGADLAPIWRDELDLVPGTVELARAGVTPGDEMLFKVVARSKETNGVPGRVLSEDTYKVETVLMGFHREFGASVILARGLGGGAEERDWKPNVAAHVHWFYRYRNESGLRKTWNAIQPGLGIHLASLDQGEQDVEFGVGGNLTMFQGLIVGGGGCNLSNDERPYVFVGLSLLNTLEKVRRMR